MIQVGFEVLGLDYHHVTFGRSKIERFFRTFNVIIAIFQTVT